MNQMPLVRLDQGAGDLIGDVAGGMIESGPSVSTSVSRSLPGTYSMTW